MAGNFQITSFEQTQSAKPGAFTDTCSGGALNSGTDDYSGIVVIDLDAEKIIQSAISTEPIPSGYTIVWTTAKDVIMPNKDWNLRCGVGYYNPATNVIQETDYRDFTITKKAFVFPTWAYAVIGIGAIGAVLLLTKK